MADENAALARNLIKSSRRLQALRLDYLVPAWEPPLVEYALSGKSVLVIEGGRRSFKSASALVYGSNYVLNGSWRQQLSKGDRGVFAIIAQSIDTGKYLLSRMRVTLDALGAQFESETTERLVFRDLPVEVKVYACNEKAFLSRSIVGCFCDEVAAWLKRDEGSNARADGDGDDTGFAAGVISALEPAMAMITGAPLILCSAPEGPDTYHHQRFVEGNTARQMVVHMPTYTSNPKLPEAKCRELAGSERNFLVRYAAIPQEPHNAQPFVSGPIDNARHPNFDRGRPFGRRIICADPSSGTGGDAFVHIVAGINERANGDRVLCIDWIATVGGKFATRKSGSEICAELADNARKFGASLVCTDQRETLLMTSELPKHGLKVKVFPHQTQNKQEAVERLQLLLEQGLLALPSRGAMLVRKQLLAYQETSTRTGLKRYAAKGSKPGGDDVVSALLTLMMADQAGLLEGSLQHRARPKDPPPRAGLQLQFANSGPNGIDRVIIGADGRARVGGRGTYRGQFSGGGF